MLQITKCFRPSSSRLGIILCHILSLLEFQAFKVIVLSLCAQDLREVCVHPGTLKIYQEEGTVWP